MSARKVVAPSGAKQESVGPELSAINEVRLVGRLATDPQQGELPTGDTVWNLRVIVDRPAAAVRGPARVDALECAVWAGRLKRSVPSWRAGDVVEVAGALRRRFFRSGGAVASRFEVELTSGKVIRRRAAT